MENLKIPKHIAIIMDGNGRWAKKHNLPRTQGHIEGVLRVEEIMDASVDLGVKVLTLYTFSTENWTRPENEVNVIMSLVSDVLKGKIKKLQDRNIRFQYIGKESGIPEGVLKSILWTMKETEKNTGMVLNMAFNYGARVEILDAVKKLASDVRDGKIAADNITEEVFGEELYTRGLPDPDLLIRTSGEKRISNFLLWQLSYAEFYFTEKLWPDFTAEELRKAIEDYSQRDRRFGNVGAPVNL